MAGLGFCNESGYWGRGSFAFFKIGTTLESAPIFNIKAITICQMLAIHPKFTLKPVQNMQRKTAITEGRITKYKATAIGRAYREIEYI